MKTKDEVLKSMRELGYCVIPQYWSVEKCLSAIEALRTLPSHTLEIGQGGDIRCQHSNKYLVSASDFLNDTFIQEIANEYSSCNRPDRTLAGILSYEEGKEKDSGGGWHMDSTGSYQFKSIMYLNDVNENTGPFAFVQKSKEASRTIPTHSNLRILEETIRDVFRPEDVLTITGSAGTCVLVDTTFPHRGTQIKAGIRYSYTVYFYN